MPIDLDLDVLEEDELPRKFDALPRSYGLIAPINLGGLQIFYDEQKGKRQEDFSERKKPHYVEGKR